MSFLAYHSLEELLLTTGGPKRRGLFDSEAVFDSIVVDAAIRQTINYGACLGACLPVVALQVLATIYKNRDWSSEDAPGVKDFIEKARVEWDLSNKRAPSEIVPPIAFSNHSKQVSVKHLHDKKFQSALEEMFVEALLWGLINPDKFKSWYEIDYNRIKENLPVYEKAGLDIGYSPTLDEYIQENKRMIADYENKMGELSEIPPELTQIANSLHIKLA